MPQKAAGMRTLPAPSVPTPMGPRPAATAAAVPPEEPPGVWFRFQGLRVMPVAGELVSPLQPNSGVVVLPSNTAPASRKRAVAGASTSQGWFGSMVRLPRRVGQPWVRIRSLMDVGTPSKAPTGVPCWRCACQRASLARALAKAAGSSTRQKALICGLTRSMRESTACVTSTGEAWPLRYSASSSWAGAWVRSWGVALMGVPLQKSSKARPCSHVKDGCGCWG